MEFINNFEDWSIFEMSFGDDTLKWKPGGIVLIKGLPFPEDGYPRLYMGKVDNITRGSGFYRVKLDPEFYIIKDEAIGLTANKIMLTDTTLTKRIGLTSDILSLNHKTRKTPFWFKFVNTTNVKEVLDFWKTVMDDSKYSDIKYLPPSRS